MPVAGDHIRKRKSRVLVSPRSGNWGEVINSYFEKTGRDPKNPYDALKMQNEIFGDGQGETVWLQRIGYVDEYGAAITWLGSKTNSYMTGANIVVHGGSEFHS